MKEELTDAVRAANAALGYDRLCLCWVSDWEARIDAIADFSGTRVSRSYFMLPHELERALAAILRIEHDYRTKKPALLARLKRNG